MWLGLQIAEQWRAPVAAHARKNFSSEASAPRPLTLLTDDELAMQDTSKWKYKFLN